MLANRGDTVQTSLYLIMVGTVFVPVPTMGEGRFISVNSLTVLRIKSKILGVLAGIRRSVFHFLSLAVYIRVYSSI